MEEPSAPGHISRGPLHKWLRCAAWTLFGIVGLSLTLYAIAVAINWRDRPPSEAVAQLEDHYRRRPTVPDRENAYVYVLGFGASPAEDPAQLGLKRVVLLREPHARHGYQWPADFGSDDRSPTSARPEVVRRLIEACRPPRLQCAEAMERASDIHAQWSAAEPWLFERYTQLTRHTRWSEVVPIDPADPLPSYSRVVDGQLLLLLEARVLVDHGEVEAAVDLLNTDVRFWRMVLVSADTLITRMIATVALARHFEGSSLVLRQSPDARAPAEWLKPFSTEELSMRRCLAGEWIFVKNTFSDTAAESLNSSAWSTADRIQATLMEPLFQRQDMLNRYARALLDSANESERSLAEYRLERSTHENEFPLSLYNPVGTLLLSGYPGFHNYAVRTADLEGIRRAALAAVQLRNARIEPSSVERALRETVLRNPYDQTAFAWSEKERAIVFTGLEPGDRGVHRIVY